MGENDQPDDQPTHQADSAPAPKKAPNPPSDIEYERWWKTWQTMGEPRGHVRLAKLVRANIHRVRHCVNVGWPERNIAALKDRTLVQEKAGQQVVEKILETAQAKALEAVAEHAIGSWLESAKASLVGLQSVDQAIRDLAANLAKAAAGASFVSYRRVPDVVKDPITGQDVMRRDDKGNVIMILRPFVSASAVAHATRTLATAAKDHAALSKLLLASISPEDRPQILSGPPALVLMMPDSDDIIDPLPGGPKADVG